MILAFDLATKTGWAAGEREPVLGSARLAGEGCTPAEAGAGLIRLMTDLVGEYDPSLIVFERPIKMMVPKNSPKFKTTPKTLYRLSGLAFTCEAIASTWGIKVEDVAVSTARTSFLGKGNTPKGPDAAKAAVFAGCKMRGWSPRDEDQSDAACIWDYAASRHRATGPLFRNA